MLEFIKNHWNHFLALVGSLTLIFFLIKIEKDKHDKNPKYKGTWKEFFLQSWDDFLFAIISGQALALFQQGAFMFIASWLNWTKPEELYKNSETAISFCLGFSGAFIIGYLYKYVVKKTITPEK